MHFRNGLPHLLLIALHSPCGLAGHADSEAAKRSHKAFERYPWQPNLMWQHVVPAATPHPTSSSSTSERGDPEETGRVLPSVQPSRSRFRRGQPGSPPKVRQQDWKVGAHLSTSIRLTASMNFQPSPGSRWMMSSTSSSPPVSGSRSIASIAIRLKLTQASAIFSTRSLSNIMYISNWLSHSRPLPSLIAITCTALCCRISKQSPRPRLLVLKLLHMPIY